MADIEDIKDAIKTAIQMEKDGYSYYKKAAAQTSSEMGRAVFESLSEDEQTHLDIFQKMFNETIGESEWDSLVSKSSKYKEIQVFPKDLKSAEGVHPDTNELDALRIAMDSEQEAIDYYTEILENSKDDEVKRIIDKIIEQEKNHYFLLEQEFSHLSATGYWYELDYLGG